MDETTNTTTAAVTTASNSKIKEYAMLILVGIVVAFGFAVLARIFSVTVFYAVLFVEMVATCVLLEVLLRALEGPSKVKDLLRKIATIAWMVPIFIFFVSLVIHVTGGSMLDSMVMMEKIGWKHVLFDGSTKQMEINLIIGLIGIWLSWRLAFGSFAGAKKSKGLASGIFALLAIIIIAREYIPIVPALERYGQATMVASADTIDVQAMGVEANMNPRVYIATTNLYEMGKNGKELLFNKGDKMALVSTKVRKEGQESMVEVIRELDEKFEEPLQTHWVQWRLIRPESEVVKKEPSNSVTTMITAKSSTTTATTILDKESFRFAQGPVNEVFFPEFTYKKGDRVIVNTKFGGVNYKLGEREYKYIPPNSSFVHSWAGPDGGKPIVKSTGEYSLVTISKSRS